MLRTASWTQSDKIRLVGKAIIQTGPQQRVDAMILAAQSTSTPSALKDYHAIALLTDGYSTPFLAKTAISLLRYRSDDVAVILDAAEAGRTAVDLFGAGGDIPVVGSIDEYATKAKDHGTQASCIDALFIGIAPPGGNLPGPWRAILLDAIERGIDIVSGLHEFLSDDVEFQQRASDTGCRLIDVRKNHERETAKGVAFRDGCLRIHTVGHDCSVGKMVVALEVQREMEVRGVDAQFVATGQTGIMICGEGVPVDCVVSDFVNGAVENLVRRHEQHDVLFVEGQGSISHPSFSAVTLGLLHGCAPDGLIFCYEVGRTMVKGLDGVPLLPNRALIEAYEANASLRHPARVIGIAMNSRNVSAAEAEVERIRIAEEFGLPVSDVYRDGAGVLADAVSSLQREMGR